MPTLTIKLCFDPDNDIFYADVAETRLTSHDLAEIKFTLNDDAFDLLEDLNQLHVRL